MELGKIREIWGTAWRIDLVSRNRRPLLTPEEREGILAGDGAIDIPENWDDRKQLEKERPWAEMEEISLLRRRPVRGSAADLGANRKPTDVRPETPDESSQALDRLQIPGELTGGAEYDAKRTFAISATTPGKAIKTKPPPPKAPTTYARDPTTGRGGVQKRWTPRENHPTGITTKGKGAGKKDLNHRWGNGRSRMRP